MYTAKFSHAAPAAFQIPAFGSYKIFGLTRGFLSLSSEVPLTLTLILGHLGARQSIYFVVMVHYFVNYVTQGAVEDEKTRKKREKMERKASKAKIIKTRNR